MSDKDCLAFIFIFKLLNQFFSIVTVMSNLDSLYWAYCLLTSLLIYHLFLYPAFALAIHKTWNIFPLISAYLNLCYPTKFSWNPISTSFSQTSQRVLSVLLLYLKLILHSSRLNYLLIDLSMSPWLSSLWLSLFVLNSGQLVDLGESE